MDNAVNSACALYCKSMGISDFSLFQLFYYFYPEYSFTGFESVNSDSFSETIEKCHRDQKILPPNQNLLIKMSNHNLISLKNTWL